LFWALSKVKEL